MRACACVCANDSKQTKKEIDKNCEFWCVVWSAVASKWYKIKNNVEHIIVENRPANNSKKQKKIKYTKKCYCYWNFVIILAHIEYIYLVE